MKWEMLILTQPSRAEYLAKLMEVLGPQVNPLVAPPTSCYAVPPWNHVSPDGELGVRAMMFDKAWPVGENRQAMVLASRADYISFIDDDDLVAPDYVNKIFPLLDGVDIVGFNVECFHDGSRLGTAYHSLEYGSWFRDGNKFYRDLSYMQPIRRELALRSRIEGGYGEDHRWAERLRALGCVKTEHRLNEVLYFYYYRSDKVVPA